MRLVSEALLLRKPLAKSAKVGTVICFLSAHLHMHVCLAAEDETRIGSVLRGERSRTDRGEHPKHSFRHFEVWSPMMHIQGLMRYLGS
jgi:hypothetical protein